MYGQQTQSDLSNQLSDNQIANKLISQENSIVFENQRLSYGHNSVADASNNVTQKQGMLQVPQSTATNIEPKSGNILKLDRSSLKIKYVTEQNSSKKVNEHEDHQGVEAMKFKSASNNNSGSGVTDNKKIKNIVSSIQKKE